MSDNSSLEARLQAKEAINREYGLMVKVTEKTIQVKDYNSKGEVVHYPSRMIYLVPEVSTSASEFFDAWLPGVTYKNDGSIMHQEVGVKFSHPIHRVIRCGVCRKNANFPDAHHLMLMSSESAEDILARYIGQTIQVYVLPGNQGEEAIG